MATSLTRAVQGRFSRLAIRSACRSISSSSSSSAAASGSGARSSSSKIWSSMTLPSLFASSSHSFLLKAALPSSALALACLNMFGDSSAEAESSLDLAAIDKSHVFIWGSAPGESDDNKAKSEPNTILPLENAAAVKVVSSGENIAVLTKYGELFTFGRGTNGALGHDEDASEAEPRLVEALVNKQIKDVDCSNFHMVAVTKSGRVYSWGRNWMGQLGLADDRRSNVLLPTQITVLNNVPVKSVACGRNHTIVLSEEGEVYAFGSNADGQLGIGDNLDKSVPTLVRALEGIKIVQVAAGKGVSFFLSESGDVYSCGHDVYGELGHGKPGYILEPRKLSAFRRLKVEKIGCGEHHAAAVTEDGRVFAWGFGKDGQNGRGDTNNVPFPSHVTSLQGQRIIDIACGQGHTAAVTEHGQLFMWGRGRSGQLGRGDQLESVASYRTEALPVPFFAQSNVTVRSVALGNNHSVAVSW